MPQLTEQEKHEIIRFIEEGKPLPEQYRFVLFDEKPEAEERFRLITESIYDCVSLVDTSGVYRYVSPSYKKTLGYAPEELIGRNGFSITHPDDLERILKLYVERMEKSYNEIKYETRLLHRAGHYVPMEVTALAINSPQGKLTGGVLVARDITERKQAEEALQRQLRYEQAIALASTCLLNYENAPHETLHDAIACLREAMDVSRVYIFENSDDPAAGLCVSLTHETCAPGVPPGIDNPFLQQMPYSSGMERWREMLSNKKAVWGDVCDFPESERANLEPQGIVSIMVLPIFSGGRWYGFVGFDETLKQRKWGTADVALLKAAADMIGIFMAHMRTQEALRESQERYYGVYETAPIAFVLWDRARHITDWNRHAEKTFGWSREEALGRNFFDLILPESARASVEDVVTRLLEGLMPSRSINENIKKDGSIILCAWNNAIQYDSRGEVVGVLSLALDITERKQAEEALQASEEKYRSILEKIEDGYFEVDLAGNFTFFNDSMCRILGYSREELMGMNYRKYTDPVHAKKVFREYNQVYRTGKSLKAFDWEYVKKDGEKCYLDTSVSLIKDSKSAAVGFRGIARDITERKQAETYREMGREILQVLNEPGDLKESIQRVLAALKTWTGVDAVGLRLQEDEDFPYFAQDGFSNDFLLTENTLVKRGMDCGVCRDKDGNVSLECTCGLVISGKTDPSNPLFTKGGSSWTNDSFPFLDLPSDQDPRLQPRNKCIHEGYASVALIPIRIQDQMYSRETFTRHGFSSMAQVPVRTSERIVGLIQLNDKRKDRFTLETIEILEGIAAHIGSVLMRKQSEATLLSQKAHFESLFINTNEAMTFFDTEHCIVNINNMFTKIFGYTLDEVQGKNINIVMDPHNQAHEYASPQILQGKQCEMEDVRYTKSGEPKNVLLKGGPVFEQGEIVGGYAIYVDITERKQAEKDKEKLQTQLNQAQKMESVGRLAGGVAHDFNNKLTIINGYAEMALEMMEPSNSFYKPFREILTAGIKSAAIVRQLLAFARKQTICPVQLDLNDTISNMLKMLQRLIGENIDLAWQPGKKLWSLKTDPSQVDQIMMNLAVNARDAMSDVGKLTIETKNTVIDDDYCKTNPEANPGRYVMLSVTDNGSGMDKETFGNLFEPFFTTKEIGKGTGLGLATIYGIVKQNNGFINVYSELGTGTTFKIYLPRHEAEESSVKPAIEVTKQLPVGTETILVVEDEKSLLHMARQMLERLGYTVEIAKKPHEALKLSEAYEGTIHLLLTDVVMPEMNGRDLSSQMTMIRPGLKTLYMSGYTADAIVHHGVLDPGVLFIQKPISMQELAAKVREAIEQQ